MNSRFCKQNFFTVWCYCYRNYFYYGVKLLLKFGKRISYFYKIDKQFLCTIMLLNFGRFHWNCILKTITGYINLLEFHYSFKK